MRLKARFLDSVDPRFPGEVHPCFTGFSPGVEKDDAALGHTDGGLNNGIRMRGSGGFPIRIHHGDPRRHRLLETLTLAAETTPAFDPVEGGAGESELAKTDVGPGALRDGRSLGADPLGELTESSTDGN